ncbi:DUF2752 domain-containing protein [bacterium AH-315-J21]|nr:DUF2752 domain-containing protein [bacterium AH-315-J21]
MSQIALQFFQRYWIALVALGASGALLILFFFNPAETSWYPHCILHEVTGWHCPSCGALRAGHLLLHGEFAAAMSMNLLAVSLLPAYLAVYSYRRFSRGEGLRFHDPIVSRPVIWLFWLTVGAFWIMRNIDIAPLNWLAP